MCVCVQVCTASMKPLKQSHWQQLGGLLQLQERRVNGVQGTGGVSSSSQFSTWLSMMVTVLPVCVIINSGDAQRGNFSFHMLSWFLSQFQLYCRLRSLKCAHFKHELALLWNLILEVKWSFRRATHRRSISDFICFSFVQDENVWIVCVCVLPQNSNTFTELLVVF